MDALVHPSRFSGLVADSKSCLSQAFTAIVTLKKVLNGKILMVEEGANKCGTLEVWRASTIRHPKADKLHLQLSWQAALCLLSSEYLQ